MSRSLAWVTWGQGAGHWRACCTRSDENGEEGSLQHPYLGLTVELEVKDLREVLEQLPPRCNPWPDGGFWAFVGQVDGRLDDCLERLVRLADMPDAVPVLLMREIYCWLLSGPNGGALTHLALPGSHISRVSRAVQTIQRDIAKSHRVEELAEISWMSVASFHRNFKQVTALSPLQFQKQLRLMEARRVMVVQGNRCPRRPMPWATKACRSSAGNMLGPLAMHPGATWRGSCG
jgi:hypothetical protein